MADKKPSEFTEDNKFEARATEKQAPLNIAFDRISKLENSVNEIKDIKKDFMVVVGIFAAVVAFLTVEAKIFESAKTSSQAFGLSCFIIAGLLSFLLLLKSTLTNSLLDAWKMMLHPVVPLIILLLWLGSHMVK